MPRSNQISGREGSILTLMQSVSLSLDLCRKLLDNFEEMKRQFGEVSEAFCMHLYRTVYTACARVLSIHRNLMRICLNTGTMNYYM